MSRIAAVVLAGGPADAVAAQQTGAPNKAFVEIGGRPLVARVLGALRASPSIGHLIVVAPQGSHGNAALALADELRPDGVRITESLCSGLRDLPPDDIVLVVASDLPILNPTAVEDFIARTLALDADLVYGCVERRAHMARFPTVPHTWVRLRDGTFCGGGLIAMRPRALPLLTRVIERLGAARKRPWRLASLFGWDILARFALGRLSVAAAEDRATAILGAPARALISPFPETAVNVDRITDIALAEALIAPG